MSQDGSSADCKFPFLACWDTLTSTMSDWQARLRNLEGLSKDDKLYLEGKLLALGDDGRAARFFQDNEPDRDTVRRLSSLLPEAGERRLHTCTCLIAVLGSLYTFGEEDLV